jgi:hypothetical protein
MAGRAGVIDLRDLSARYAWDTLALDKLLAAAGLVGASGFRHRVAPPEVVVAVVPFEDYELVERSSAWLADAQRIVVLRVHDPASAFNDAEVVDYVEELWTNLAKSFAVPCELFDWREPPDVAGVLQHASELARWTTCFAPPALPPAPRELRPGPRFELSTSERFLDPSRALACGLRLVQGQAMLDTGAGQVRLMEQIEPVTLTGLGLDCAVLPDGRQLVRGPTQEGRGRWSVDSRPFVASGHYPLGFDAHYSVGWTGYRMFPFWLYVGQTGVGFLSACDHDFPCGPSKKLYGYANNDPLRVELARDLSAVAYFFEHDVLLTSALPIRWSDAGELDVASFPRDPARAVFFVHEVDSPFSSDLLDEDARDRPPVVVLAQSERARYAVDLSGPTYRILGATPQASEATFLGGPEPAFAVFDQEDRLIRKAQGRLLGGAAGRALVQHENYYFREHLGSGERVELSAAVGAAVCAVPVPGTVNVLLVTTEGDRQFAQLL